MKKEKKKIPVANIQSTYQFHHQIRNVWPARVLSGHSVVGAGGWNWMAAKKHRGQEQRVAAWRRWAVALGPGEGTTTQMWSQGGPLWKFARFQCR